MRFKRLGFALFAGVALLSSSVQALDVTESFDVSGLRWDVDQHGGATLRVTGPSTFLFEQTFETGETVFIDFADMPKMANGQYRYEVVIAPIVTSDEAIEMQLSREFGESSKRSTPQGATASGSFQIHSGLVVNRDRLESVAKDQVILDDLIVDGSACIGFDCVNGESFGFDTLRLKENNLRIKFQDTSSSASFPSNDWQITINDSANGGANKFSIDDIDSGRTPFTIEAGAPSHSLYVDDGGRLGLGTNTPVVQLHVKDGNTPTLRLEQDGSSGFTPQTWDVGGNEANYFIRDATNGSTLPFRIFPGAPSNALTIEASTGHIGLGTTSPLGPLHIKGPGSQRQMILLEQTTADSNWVIANYETSAAEGAGNFGINQVGGGNRFKIDTAGNIYFPALPNCSNGLQTDASGMISCLP